MKVNVKRSDLLRLYRIFNGISPEVTTIYLIMNFYDYILLAKIVASVFVDNFALTIVVDDKTLLPIHYQSLSMDKDILKNVLSVMDQQAILNEDGNINVEFTNGLQILHLLEKLLLGKEITDDTYQPSSFLMEEQLFSILKKLGYRNFNEEDSIIKGSYLKTGDLVHVADNSGANFVRIVSEIEPSVYIVTVTKTNLGYQYKFPYGKKYCGVLVRFTELGYYSRDEVCLFNYYDGIKEPLFTSIYNGTVAPCNNLTQYEAIIRSSIFKKDDCIRVDMKTYAKITEILKVTDQLEGSEFVVTLLSDLYVSSKVSYTKSQLVKGTLHRKSFVNKNSALSYYSLDVYELEISSLTGERNHS